MRAMKHGSRQDADTQHLCRNMFYMQIKEMLVMMINDVTDEVTGVLYSLFTLYRRRKVRSQDDGGSLCCLFFFFFVLFIISDRIRFVLLFFFFLAFFPQLGNV
jgi:hypothetical protein